MTKILFVITAATHWTLADGTRQPAGFWAEEALGPYEIFTEAGYEIAAATPGGVPPTADALSLTPEFNGGPEGAERMKAALRDATELAHPMRIEDVRIDDYDAVFYPGGWGPMEDLPDNAESGRLLTDWLASGKPLALVCHGPAALLATIDADGKSPFAGYRLTGLSNAEEKPRTDWRTGRSGCCRTGWSTIWARTTARASPSLPTSRWTAPSSPARTRARPYRWPRNCGKPWAEGTYAMIKPVSFRNKAVEIAGHLHLPDDFSEDKTYPAIVGIHPAGGVKEQTIGLYAKRLAAHGFVTMVYDSSYQGASGGEPRLLEDPTTRVEDARCGADFLTTLPFVDTERMGVFGICAGGGYAISVAQTERRFKALATVSAAPDGRERPEPSWGTPSRRPSTSATLEMVANQRTAEARGEEPHYAPFVPERLEDIDENTPDMLREGYDYYRTPRGAHPNSKGRFLLTSMDKMYAFSTFDLIPEFLTQPMLLIAGSKADTKLFSDQAYELSNGPKELFVVDGATHIAMYDVPEYVDQAVAKLAEFYSKNLADIS